VHGLRHGLAWREAGLQEEGQAMSNGHQELPPILPVGTAVVTRGEVSSQTGPRAAGAMGVIVRAPADPEHSYRVRFPGGEEVSLRRGEFEVLKHCLDPKQATSGTSAGTR
jgi:hypothetical protein